MKNLKIKQYKAKKKKKKKNLSSNKFHKNRPI